MARVLTIGTLPPPRPHFSTSGERLSNRIQLTSDGHKAYLEAIEGAFGADIDYAMLARERQGPL
jgi:hypothetical protein